MKHSLARTIVILSLVVAGVWLALRTATPAPETSTRRAALADVPEPIDLVLIFQRSENVPPFVEQAIECGAKAVWMQLGIANEAAAERARAAGLDVVEDACMLVEHRHWKR